ncbi:MAG: Amuc_1102 family pilus-like protein [Verrucomicrobiales bacterium]
MKSPFIFRIMLATVAVAADLGVSSALAQDDKTEKLIDLKQPIIQAQQTPDLKGTGVKEKRWKPKDWLEFEVPFIASPPNSLRSTFTSFDVLNFKYYLYLDNPDDKKKRILTADLNHVNVPINEPLASVVYLSPSAVLRLTGVPRIVPNDVKNWAVEVSYNGKVVGFISSSGKSPTDPKATWWKSPNAPPTEAGVLKNKTETPFAPLWGDYHAEVQSK